MLQECNIHRPNSAIVRDQVGRTPKSRQSRKLGPLWNCTTLPTLQPYPRKKNFSVVQNMQGKNKKLLGYEMRIREALEIRRHNCGPGRGLNEDMGAYVRTDIWDPVLVNSVAVVACLVDRGTGDQPNLGSFIVSLLRLSLKMSLLVSLYSLIVFSCPL